MSTSFFYGSDIMSELELDPNQTHVPIALICEIFGVPAAAQEKRIKSHAVLRDGARTVQIEAENGYRAVLGLRVDLLPLWLAGIDAAQVVPAVRPKLDLFQREAASLLWQASHPQGYGSEDALLPERFEQTPAEMAYVGAQGIATLSRQQMLIERQLDAERIERGNARDDVQSAAGDASAELLARTVRRVAQALAERTRRNEYAGIFSGLYRQFGIASYRRMPQARLHEALEWLERWHGDILGEPEPPPDI